MKSLKLAAVMPSNIVTLSLHFLNESGKSLHPIQQFVKHIYLISKHIKNMELN